MPLIVKEAHDTRLLKRLHLMGSGNKSDTAASGSILRSNHHRARMNFKELPDSDILTQKELARIPDIEMDPVVGTAGGVGGGDQRFGNTFVGSGSESSIPDHGPWDAIGEGRQIMVRKDFTVASEMHGLAKGYVIFINI